MPVLLSAAPLTMSVRDTVAIAVLTALLTTLVVEYFAKPRLEARKERILRSLRSRDELVTILIELAIDGEYIAAELPKELTGQVRNNVLADRRRVYDRMQAKVDQLQDARGLYAGLYVGPIRTLVIDYVAHLKGLMLSARTQSRKGHLIRQISEPMGWVIAPPAWWMVWYIPRRVRSLFKVRELVAAAGEDSASQEPMSEEDSNDRLLKRSGE